MVATPSLAAKPNLTPEAVRLACRAGRITQPTSGMLRIENGKGVDVLLDGDVSVVSFEAIWSGAPREEQPEAEHSGQMPPRLPGEE